ncbi:MAG: inorganic phosphate transporter [Chloroflexota bacterium]
MPRRWTAAAAAAAVASVVVALVPATHLGVGLALVAVLAVMNGANDISKSIATLVGSGVADERRAVRWGSVMTLAGAVLGGVVGAGLTATFSTRLLPVDAVVSGTFALAVLVGAIGWLVIATRTGLPVSTTHALVGAIVASGVLAYGAAGMQWWLVLTAVVVPLIVSPLLGVVLGVTLGRLVGTVAVGTRPLTALHWLTSGLTAAARGMNDAPKVAGLGVLVLLGSGQTAGAGGPLLLIVVAAGMTVGSLWGGRRVIHTLARRLTRLDHRDGAASNAATATLVTAAAVGGMPVSTTQVAGGSIAGVGLGRGASALNLGVVREVALAWVVTAPSAGIIACAAWLILRLAAS